LVRQIRFYVEGAPELREGFSGFLRALQQQARQRRLGWAVVMCGSRTSAYDAFRLALQTHRDALNVLLVDAERPVAETAREHLSSPQGDRWNLADVDDEQCHLMAQAMEAWFVADPEALASYYGQGFLTGALPRNPRVEEIPKVDLAPSLANATRNSQKGKYHKTRHAPALLARLNPATVRSYAPHCDRLFATIERHLS
jgi:hypothetical protein